MASSPNEENDPKFVVDQNYIIFTKGQRLKDKLAGQLTSAYAAYDPNGQKGTHIEHGTPVPGQRYKQYPPRTELAQPDPGYARAHPREGRLPKDAAGRRNVYGVHEGMPLEGPVNWTEFYQKWTDVGPQLNDDSVSDPISRTGPLNQSELDFCKKYGFEFKEKIGSGGFGEVWTVDWHQKDSKGNPFKETYAVKVIDLQLFLRIAEGLHDAVSYMLKEAELTKNLIHDNIVRIENVFHIHEQETGFPMVRVLLFMTMCDGDVAHLLSQKSWLPWLAKFSEDEARVVMWDVCQGLKYLHDHNIVHLDIKPPNILYKENPMSGRRIYKLCDFGLSKALSNTDTKINKMEGVYRYLAPEVNKEDSDAKLVDIYALGTTLAEMLVSVNRIEECRQDLWPPDPNNPVPDYTPDQTTMQGLQIKWKLSFQALDLIRKMTVLEPERRPTIDQVIADEWFNESNPISSADCTLS